MITLLFLVLTGASVFSLGGMGEDQSVFRDDFVRRLNNAQIGFSLRPEFEILNESTDFRGLFWTNPFVFNLKIPVTSTIVASVGNQERFNQAFDTYLENDQLNVHLVSEGGVEEIYGQINNRIGTAGESGIPVAEVYFRGSYLFGGTREMWTYTISDYSIADTFVYKYLGCVFGGGVSVSILSCAFEGLGFLDMDMNNSDTALSKDLPERLSIGLHPSMNEYQIDLVYEHPFWSDSGFRSVNRFLAGIHKNSIGIAYAYNPWYIPGVTEHRLALNSRYSFKGLGFGELTVSAAIRNKNSIREIAIVPELKFVIEEIFARRKK
ncbi:MAG TPA: hypothetical protein VF399_07280 [bacterium]